MAQVIATGLCCCFSCCCQQLSESLRRVLGTQRVTKVFYFAIIVVFMVPALLAFFFISRWKGFFSYFSGSYLCNQYLGFQCMGSSVVLRMSLALVALFFILMLIMACRTRCSMVVNQGLFCFKYMFVVGAFIALLFAPNANFISGYSQATKYISIVFLLMQAIILIDLFYLAGIKLVKRYDEGEKCCAGTLIVLTLIFESVAIAMNVAGYVNFSSGKCGSTLWVNIITSIILVLLPILQLLHFNIQNSLLTTAMVCNYVSYLSFIAQFSYGNAACSRMTVPSLVGDILASTFFFVLTMYGSIMGGSGQVKVTEGGDVNKAMGVASTEARDPAENKIQLQKNISQREMNFNQQQQEEGYTTSCAWTKWHFYMTLASIYLPILITNWNSADYSTDNLEASAFGFWVRVILSWVTTLIYIWTLLAPRVFPDRNFVVE